MLCSVCNRKFNSKSSYYRHSTWSDHHLLRLQLIEFEKEIKELQKLVDKEPLNQPFYSSQNKFQKLPILDLMKADTWYSFRNKIWILNMKYSMRLKQYVCKSPYPYYIVQSDIELTKFDVWTNTKLFNAWLYSEDEVVAMIEAKYPGSQRVARSHRSRPRHVLAQALTRRKPYPAKQSLTPP